MLASSGLAGQLIATVSTGGNQLIGSLVQNRLTGNVSCGGFIGTEFNRAGNLVVLYITFNMVIGKGMTGSALNCQLITALTGTAMTSSAVAILCIGMAQGIYYKRIQIAKPNCGIIH